MKNNILNSENTFIETDDGLVPFKVIPSHYIPTEQPQIQFYRYNRDSVDLGLTNVPKYKRRSLWWEHARQAESLIRRKNTRGLGERVFMKRLNKIHKTIFREKEASRKWKITETQMETYHKRKQSMRLKKNC